MSMCAGRIDCVIYRDKKYCSKATVDNYHECNCRHARYGCEVTRCSMEEYCHGRMKKDVDK